MFRPYLNNRDRMDYYHPHLKSDLPDSVLARVLRVDFGTVGDNHAYGVDCEEILGSRADMDFTNGGNDGRYRYVPKKQLWIDMAYTPPRTCHTLIHEGIESPLMVVYGLHYFDAHDVANVHEDLVLQAIRRGDVLIRTYAEAVRFADAWLRATVPQLGNNLPKLKHPAMKRA